MTESTQLSMCPKCETQYPDYHAIDEGGFLCEQCGYWSGDPEPVRLRVATGTEGFKRTRKRLLDGKGGE